MSSPNSPVAEVREGLQAAITEAAELNCFAFTEPLTVEDFAQRAGDCPHWLCAEVGFRGAFDGVLRVAMPAPLAATLCASFIGDVEDGGPAEQQVFDFTGELANMAVGAWLSRTHTHAVFNLSHPDVAVMPEGWQPFAFAGEAPALLAVNDAPVAAWVAIVS